MVYIRVPATTANMGPGFDSLGMALNLYNSLWFESDTDAKPDYDNLIYKAVLRLYSEIGKSPRGIRIRSEAEIPMSRGLGSSAACIAAGLFGANALAGNPLNKKELIALASEMEGHPDNIAPAILGGAVVSVLANGTPEYIRLSAPRLNELTFCAIIPSFELSTSKARGVLPSSYSRSDAVYNISRCGLLVAALERGDFSKLRTAMTDRLHEPYRMSLIPGMTEILDECEKNNALGCFLSGAGPTLMAVIKERNPFEKKMNEFLKAFELSWEMKFLEPDLDGILVQ